MLPYAFALFVTLGLLFHFQLTTDDLSFEDDKAKAYASNFTMYRQGIDALIQAGKVKTSDKSVSEKDLLDYLNTFRPGFLKAKNWQTVIKDGKCYLYVSPADMPHRSAGRMEMHLIDMLGNSVLVGHKVGTKNGSLQRGAQQETGINENATTKPVTYTVPVPDSIPENAVVSIISIQ